MKILLTAFWCAAAFAEPHIFYSKSFPGSTPAYLEITLEKSGAGVYKEAPDDEQPLKFKLGQKATTEIFALTEKLGHFTRPLESGLPVAKMGEKTFRWVDGAKNQEQKYNYSTDLDAQALQNWFEKMTESEQHVIALERAVRFDKLGVNKALLQMQAAIERDRLVALDQFLPWLDRVAKNEGYLNMARERAALLADAIRAAKAPVE
jgi:hypothetical protein